LRSRWRKLGAFYLQWLHALPGDELGGSVLLRFERKPARHDLAYDSGYRLKSRQVGTELTQFAYYPTGLLETVTPPDSATVMPIA
jgi:hypothetical protein